ncbi:hypothetical protein FPZ24_03770 [Sphingomonas panacisoli]|uniref:Uncharacterized protein n=1 Tax=Sphingomonas panacisoli TaxID=1813879 RepID=A0A5B8LGC3_9SPHN|nr:hypothetical protein [Sphingomonas panacisoli]QDZ06704.1 hypothetical protein FPZ24_03770 [Sphingomonas panacisoli]
MRKVLTVGIIAIAMNVSAPAAYARGMTIDPNGGAGATTGTSFSDYLASRYGCGDAGSFIDPIGGCRQ